MLHEYYIEIFREHCNASYEDECWNWSGSKDSSGYGKLGTGKNILSAHRVAYTLYKGAIPAGLHVLHTCNNPACVNPAHLYAGTQKQNKQDSVRQNRHHKPKGSLNGSALLNEAAVLKIKELLANKVAVPLIAKQFAVCCGTIYNIKAGTAWSHVREPQLP